MSNTQPEPITGTGRPRKVDGPRVPYTEIDRVLVFGEIVPCADGETSDVRYPSYRELAARYGVSHSLIAQYSKRHDCLRRREDARHRVTARAEQKLVELRASALAYARDDELRLIDSFLLGFERALADGRVRFDNPTDFNLMVRLKAFIQGGADSRQEVRAALSLEELQSRHRELLERSRTENSPALTGLIGEGDEVDDGDQEQDENSPARPSSEQPQEVNGHLGKDEGS
jgi:hypothetical protein